MRFSHAQPLSLSVSVSVGGGTCPCVIAARGGGASREWERGRGGGGAPCDNVCALILLEKHFFFLYVFHVEPVAGFVNLAGFCFSFRRRACAKMHVHDHGRGRQCGSWERSYEKRVKSKNVHTDAMSRQINARK